MDILNQEVTVEILSIFGVLGSAWLISNTLNNRERSIFDRIFRRHNKITNIYQLLPILQKNSKKLFLFFTDLATSIRSVKISNDFTLTKELLEAVLSQEYYKNKLVNLQKEVFDEFSVDSQEVQRAIKKFSQDDQVEFYVSGVKRMFDSVLNGGYPQCPGVEPNKEINEAKHLEIIEKIAIAKTRSWLSKDKHDFLKNREFEEIIQKEMSKFGYDNYLDSLVAIKNSENYFNYYPTFEKAKSEILAKVKRAYNSTEIQKVTKEELQLILDTSEHDTTILVLVFDDIIHEQSFNKLLQVSYSKNPLKELNSQFGTSLNGYSNPNDHEDLAELETNTSLRESVNGSVEEVDNKLVEDIINGNEKGENETNFKNAVDQSLKDDEQVQISYKDKIVTLWVFREEFNRPETLSEFPTLAIFKGGEVDLIVDI